MPSVTDTSIVFLLVGIRRYPVYSISAHGSIDSNRKRVEILFDHQTLLRGLKRTSLPFIEDIRLANYPEYRGVQSITHYQGPNQMGETTLAFEAPRNWRKPTWRERLRSVWKALTYSPYMEILDKNDDWWTTGDLQEDIRNSR